MNFDDVRKRLGKLRELNQQRLVLSVDNVDYLLALAEKLLKVAEAMEKVRVVWEQKDRRELAVVIEAATAIRME